MTVTHDQPSIEAVTLAVKAGVDLGVILKVVSARPPDRAPRAAGGVGIAASTPALLTPVPHTKDFARGLMHRMLCLTSPQ